MKEYTLEQITEAVKAYDNLADNSASLSYRHEFLYQIDDMRIFLEKESSLHKARNII